MSQDQFYSSNSQVRVSHLRMARLRRAFGVSEAQARLLSSLIFGDERND